MLDATARLAATTIAALAAVALLAPNVAHAGQGVQLQRPASMVPAPPRNEPATKARPRTSPPDLPPTSRTDTGDSKAAPSDGQARDTVAPPQPSPETSGENAAGPNEAPIYGPTEPTSSPAPQSAPSMPWRGSAEPSSGVSSGAPAAPPRPAPRPGARSVVGPETAVSKRATIDKSANLPHRGFVASAAVGTQGCLGTLCSQSRHAAKPGVRLDGFIGGNVRGWVELGIAGGWGTMDAEVPQGTNALSLYGLDPVRLQQMADLLGNPLGFDVTSLQVQDTKLRMARGGPLARIHFIPRGRFAAYIGSGVGYSMFRAEYDTPGGNMRVDLHGLDVPVQGGFAVHVHEHVAVGAQFDYLWTWYPLLRLDHPEQSLTAPVEMLEEQMPGGIDLQGDLPSFWTLTFGIRTRL